MIFIHFLISLRLTHLLHSSSILCSILLISLIQCFSRFIPSAFISYHPHPAHNIAKLLFSAMATYQWLPTYLSLMVTFAYSQFLPWREITDYSFKIKIRIRHSFVQNVAVTLVWPSRACMICCPGLQFDISYHPFSLFRLLQVHFRAFALAWNHLYLDKLWFPC